MGKIKPKRSNKPVKIKKQNTTSGYLDKPFVGDNVILLNNAVSFKNDQTGVYGALSVVSHRHEIIIPANFKIITMYTYFSTAPITVGDTDFLYFNDSIILQQYDTGDGLKHYFPFENYVLSGNNKITLIRNFTVPLGWGGTYTSRFIIEGVYL